MKALILAAEGFEDSELLVPLYRLLEGGFEVDVAGVAKETYVGKHGYEVETTKTFHELKAKDYDVLVIPGGKAPEMVRQDKDAVAVTKAIFEAGKVVAAICHGPQVLISAGVLKGKKVTCWKGIRDDVKVAGADYADREVVVDGRLITSRCPSDLPAFCREMMKALKG